nr:JDVT-CTERM system glutamic-type intramembrane protease [Aquabacterium terrae]
MACLLLLYPCLEEWCFRGGLQAWLAARRWRAGPWFGISIANLLASLLFAAAHLPTRPIALAAATLLPSLLLGAVKERYGRIGPAIGLHAYFNAGLLVDGHLL